MARVLGQPGVSFFWIFLFIILAMSINECRYEKGWVANSNTQTTDQTSQPSATNKQTSQTTKLSKKLEKERLEVVQYRKDIEDEYKGNKMGALRYNEIECERLDRNARKCHDWLQECIQAGGDHTKYVDMVDEIQYYTDEIKRINKK